MRHFYDDMYVVVDRSQTTSGGEGTAGHIFGVVKWGMLILFGRASAVCQTFASGHSCTKTAAGTE